MARITRCLCFLTLGLCMPYFVAAAASKGSKPRGKPKVRVGNFPIVMDDARLNHNIEVAKQNETEMACLDNETYNYWYNLDAIPANETADMTAIANKCISLPENQGYNDWVIANATAEYNRELQPYKGNETALWDYDYTDFSWVYGDVVYNGTLWIPYQIIGAFMGVGKTVPCADQINTVLAGVGPWENAGSAAATTLMALIPSFLAFGNL
jgi:hypothetical protein